MRSSLQRWAEMTEAVELILHSPALLAKTVPNPMRFAVPNEPRNEQIHPRAQGRLQVQIKRRLPPGGVRKTTHRRPREQSAMKLYFSRNPNPRLAVAAARSSTRRSSLNSLRPSRPGSETSFIKLNPNLSVPILVEGEKTLWEADAIACRLSQLDEIRLLANGRFPSRNHPLDKLGLLEFRQGLRSGPFRARDQAALWPWSGAAGSRAIGTGRIRLLGRHSGTAFRREDWLVGGHTTYADFRVACILPFADLAGLPVHDFPRVEAWHARLMDIPAWRDPFAGLDAPELPPIRTGGG